MLRKLPLTIVGLTMLVGCHGHMVNATDGEFKEGHGEHHGTPHHEHGEHDHGTLEIQPGDPVPTVKLKVDQDAVKGWNLEVKVENFRFAPEKVNQESNTQEGHGHLYINEKKVTRLYGNWFYLGNLSPGENKISVSLNANGHESLIYEEKAIEDTVIISVEP